MLRLLISSRECLQGLERLDLFLLGFIQLHFPAYQFAMVQLEEIQVSYPFRILFLVSFTDFDYHLQVLDLILVLYQRMIL
jgi:hypothetical protein